ncbi:MAG: hypothetical protein WBV23_02580 [Desulfobaccales bacterium]
MDKKAETASEYLSKAAAWKFIILVGVVSLLSDMAYEGARVHQRPWRRWRPGTGKAADPLDKLLGPAYIK